MRSRMAKQVQELQASASVVTGVVLAGGAGKGRGQGL